MARGKAPPNSSPAEQERLGLNEDASLQMKKSEGEKLREPLEKSPGDPQP